jgi:hypothetical protein
MTVEKKTEQNQARCPSWFSETPASEPSRKKRHVICGWFNFWIAQKKKKIIKTALTQNNRNSRLGARWGEDGRDIANESGRAP